ncbi:MAG: hypothetical protein ACOYK8_10270 [Alphaproteobacteria bacterium]
MVRFSDSTQQLERQSVKLTPSTPVYLRLKPANDNRRQHAAYCTKSIIFFIITLFVCGFWVATHL